MASTYLSRSQSSSNQQIFTISTWVKRADFPANSYITNIASDGNNRFGIIWQAGTLSIYSLTAGIQDIFLNTSAQFRDVSAWYHIVLKIDTTQATASDRAKLYVNGTQITSFASADYPTQNLNFPTNNTHYIGCFLASNQSFNFSGSMSHYHYTDGYAYDASTFGETDATTGIWKPKGFSGSYGTNGFFLKFENSGSMGTDSSPNGNNFTVSGNLTQTVDTPSNVFCTMNPLDNYLQQATFTNGNTSIATATTPYCANTSTLGVSQGKWYFEFKDTGQGADKQHGVGMVGLQTTSASQGFPGLTANAFSYNLANGNSVVNNSQSSYGTASTLNDIYGMAVDLDNNKFWVSRNGTWINSGDPANGTNGITGITSATSTPLGAYFVAYGDQNDVSGGYSVSFNFGNGYFGTTAVSSATSDESGLGIFEYSVPSGYYCLCTKNINLLEYA